MSKFKFKKIPLRIPPLIWVIAGVVLFLGVAWWTRPYWDAMAVQLGILHPPEPAAAEEPAHEEHAHGGAAAPVVTVSEQAKANIGLKVGPVNLGVYEKSISIPAIVTERPGRTNRAVAAPLTGFVLDVFAVPGQAVKPGDPLFVLRLKDDDLIQAQSEFLNTLLALEVEQKEIDRLSNVAGNAVAGNVLLEHKYKRDQLQGKLKAQRQALLLHGLTNKQVDIIAEEHRLLREFLIRAPAPHDETEPGHLVEVHPRLASSSTPNSPRLVSSPPTTPPENRDGSPSESSESSEGTKTYLVDELPVKRGKLVQAGQTLVVLADYSLLYIGGDAFERDAAALVRAAENRWDVTAVPEQNRSQVIEGLHITYVSSEIDPETRTLRFYVALPNEIIHKARLEQDRVFPTWRYKPGQRIELHVPVDHWKNELVVPVSAVATDGAERYVFVQDGNSFRRQPVNVLFRGPDSIVIANDGSVFPGTRIAMNGAHMLLMELKNQLGGGATGGHGHGHAGHSH